jgi:hypothetical protein
MKKLLTDLEELANELDRRWASSRRACLATDSPEWRAIDAGMSRAYANSEELLRAVIVKHSNQEQP